jgi:glycosyltransferase involved in cell wall biosynthesis
MRIALVHSFYSSRLPSGENQVVLAQVDALREAGHEVLLVARHTDLTRQEAGYRVRAGLRVATGFGSDPSTELGEFSPHVVHVHNLFPNFGTRWLSRWEGPLVATLHNFRPLCANGLLYRDGHICTLCPDGNHLASVRYGCYHDSRISTLPLALRNGRGPAYDAVIQRANRIIVLAERARAIYEGYGIPPGAMSLVPNFVTCLNGGSRRAPVPERWIAVGRLSSEKGLVELMQTWPRGIALDIVGDGAARAQVESSAPAGVRVLDTRPSAELRSALPGYTGLVLPSRWREAAIPLVVIEALEAGIPVVAREGNSGADHIRLTGCGAVYSDQEPDGLAAAMRAVREGGDSLRALARATWHDCFSVTDWLAATHRTYKEAGVRS